MALPAPVALSSQIADDGKRPFTVTLDVTPHATYAVVAAPDKRKAGFICPCDLTIIGAYLCALTSAVANATFRLKIATATEAAWTGSLAAVYVSGQKFGSTNKPYVTKGTVVPNNAAIDLFATTNGLVTGWPKVTTGKRSFSKGQSIVATVTGTTAASKAVKYSLMLVCVPR